MEPKSTHQSGNRKGLLIITLVMIILATGALGGYLLIQKNTPTKETVNTAQPIDQEKKVYTQTEKEEILNRITIASSSSKEEQVKKLILLREIPVKQSTTTLSNNQKFQLLNAVQVK
ncbi:MAG: hypothetical protein A2V96_02225 [Candidatus Yonathbacteria bacterium RBG_16_43_6]|uniref:Uncharacterized protein n=1 Tax=Candidatus Yonathbacteria bacterium RIFCSPLOWO2_01_FULL_43_27 TaxID=1802726 RepID=A0A1G2SDQ4_9BACT|nr:MAG: hypothetical protein A2V96_02225 [Candidatus Yonathbacteria bacterium RBG_16_43_6]OHA78708.1 MAG: hypothetical protein A2658_01055 [Candidatus Yonathbacteria bacterium RIFCSPHIGHO2_01_FULL_44_19]OHA83193.1 MAG: hypothetical protein A3B07_00285 [Candidatus Yonathbacteria bacterium RIFCSPLOWO2_01_FULL_43_27]